MLILYQFLKKNYSLTRVTHRYSGNNILKMEGDKFNDELKILELKICSLIKLKWNKEIKPTNNKSYKIKNNKKRK